MEIESYIYTKNIHQEISKYIDETLYQYYYRPLKKKYEKDIKELFFDNEIFIMKPEMFIYLSFYFLYGLVSSTPFQFDYYIHLHGFYLSILLERELNKRYVIQSQYDTKLLKNILYTFYIFLIYGKLFLFQKKMIMIYMCLFHFGMNIHSAYKKRYLYIQDKVDINYGLIEKILIFTPNKKTIQKVSYYTRFFTFSNYLFFLSFLILFC
jgi:hypothetical protein